MKLKPLRYTDETENTKKKYLIISMVVTVAATFLIMELRSPDVQTDRYEAYSAAKEFVGKTLDKPWDAVFQSTNRAEIIDLGDNVWKINSYYDSKDSSGTVRTFFTIQVRYDGEEWSLKQLDFTGKKLMRQQK